MVKVIRYDEEKCELHTIVNGSSAVLTFDPQSPTAGFWRLVFKEMMEDAVAEDMEVQIK